MKTKNLVIIIVFLLFAAFVRADNVHLLSGFVNASDDMLMLRPYFIGPYLESSEDVVN